MNDEQRERIREAGSDAHFALAALMWQIKEQKAWGYYSPELSRAAHAAMAELEAFRAKPS